LKLETRGGHTMKCSFLSGKQRLYIRSKNKLHTTRFFAIQEYVRCKRLPFSPFRPLSVELKPRDNRLQRVQGLPASKQDRKIAEAIILQAVEDLWSAVHRQESIEFFTGEGFMICAQVVGLGTYEKLRLIQLIKKAIQKKRLWL
jgi:hypothetical protein